MKFLKMQSENPFRIQTLGECLIESPLGSDSFTDDNSSVLLNSLLINDNQYKARVCIVYGRLNPIMPIFRSLGLER